MSHSTPAGSRSSRRFWIALVCFAAANLGLWAWFWSAHRPPRRDALRVERFEPPLPSSPTPKLVWKFNFAMRPLRAGIAPAVITPALAGRWEWPDPQTLAFVPDRRLPTGSRYQFVMAPDKLISVDGFTLPEPYTTEYLTSPLQLNGVLQSGVDHDSILLEATFNDGVLPAELQSHLSILTAAGVAVPAKVVGSRPSPVLTVMAGPLPQSDAASDQGKLRFAVSAGLAGVSGPIGIETQTAVDVTVSPRLMAVMLSGKAPASGDAELTVRFNGPVDAERLRRVVSIEPAVPFTVGVDGNEATLSGPFQPGTRYAMKIAEAPGADPRYPRAAVLSTFIADRAPSAWLDHAEGYLGSAGNRTVLAHATNVSRIKASVLRVYDNNLVAWRNQAARSRWRGADPDVYGRPLASRIFNVAGSRNAEQQVRLSLDELLPPDSPRDGVYRIVLMRERSADPANSLWEPPADEDGFVECDSTLVTLSDIALSAKRARDAVYVWAVSLSRGTPLGQVQVRVYSDKNQLLGEAITDRDGLARVGPITPAEGEQPALVLARRMAPASTRPVMLAVNTSAPAAEGKLQAPARDLTWLDLKQSALDMGQVDIAGKPYLGDRCEAFIYTERGVYRPGETVHLRAIVRGRAMAMPASFPVRWQLERPDGIEWKSATASFDSDGASALDVDLPPDLPTGKWRAHLRLPGNGENELGKVTFLVEDYLPDRIKASIELAAGSDGAGTTPRAAGRYMATPGHVLSARVKADYLFGLPADGLQTDLIAFATPATFAPAQWRGWTFGDSANLSTDPAPSHRKRTLEPIVLDAQGRGEADVDFDAVLQGEGAAPTTRPAAEPIAESLIGPWRLVVSASVHEVGGRSVTATNELMVDRVKRYVGIHPAGELATPGKPMEIELAMVDPSGAVVPDRSTVTVQAYRVSWNNSLVNRDGHYRWNSTRVLDPVGKPQQLALNGGRGRWDFTPAAPGSFIVSVRDPETGFRSSTSLIASSGAWADSVSREHPEHLDLLVMRHAAAGPATRPAGPAHDKATAIGQPGDQLDVIVRSPFAGLCLLTIETDDVLSRQVIEMTGSQITVPVTLTRAMQPNAYVCATVVRRVEADEPWKTHRAFGAARVGVDYASRQLAVSVKAPKEIRPDQTLPVQVRVTDAAGRAVANAAVTVLGVDEGILQLTRYRTPDPFAFFNAARGLAVTSADIYGELMPEVPRPGGQRVVGGDAGEAAFVPLSPVPARRVRPVAMVSEIVRTDAQGMASTVFRLPEFLGKVRVMAVAHQAAGVGAGETAVLDRTPIIVQTSWPRFCAPTDRLRAPVTVINNLSSPAAMNVSVVCGPANASPLRFATGAGRFTATTRVLNPGQSQRLWVDMVASGIGVGRIDVKVAAGAEQYHETTEIPVRPPVPSVAESGALTLTTSQPAKIVLPREMIPGTGRVRLTISSRPALQLPQALQSLEEYPYGCCEQTVSKCLPLLYLRDIRAQLGDTVSDPAVLRMLLSQGMARLMSMQTANGGLAMWPGQQTPWRWGSVYALELLVEARAAGFAVPEQGTERLQTYVRGLVEHVHDDPEELELQSYACYVLAMGGHPQASAMRRLEEVLSKPGADDREIAPLARLHLAGAWMAAGRREAAAQLLPALPPKPRSQRQLDGNLGSPARDLAIALRVFLEVRPDDPAIPRLVAQLAEMGRTGQWYSTQDTAFAAMALGRYLRQTKDERPYESAELLVGGKSVAEASQGAPLAWIWSSTGPVGAGGDSGPGELQARITGPDRARGYLNWTQSGVPATPPENLDQGLEVRREYLTSDRKPLDLATVRSGELVLVQLTIRATRPLPNVVIADLLPAGLEIENPRLATTQKDSSTDAPPEVSRAPGFVNPRLDMRDDRMILIDDLSRAGEGRYAYLARAVTAGTFVVPPVQAECMYDSSIRSIWTGERKLVVLPAVVQQARR